MQTLILTSDVVRTDFSNRKGHFEGCFMDGQTKDDADYIGSGSIIGRAFDSEYSRGKFSGGSGAECSQQTSFIESNQNSTGPTYDARSEKIQVIGKLIDVPSLELITELSLSSQPYSSKDM